ncbi:MAG: hypothetical protein ACLFU7_10095 [Armatimonadota bacterium]
MDQETMLHHLEELAERLGVTIRYEAAAGRVGVCRLRGSRVAVIDANLRVPDRVAALASVLADEELDGVYIPPEVRRRLHRSCPLRVRPGQGEQDVAGAGDSSVGETQQATGAGDPAVAEPPADDQVAATDNQSEHSKREDAGPEADAD